MDTTALISIYPKELYGSGVPELSKISRGTVSKILSASNIKQYKTSSYTQQRDSNFEPKSAVGLKMLSKTLSIDNGIGIP
jgi:hypothetical protein